MLNQTESFIHGGTPPAALSQGINLDYIAKQVQEFNRTDTTFEQRDDVLFRIGSYADVFDETDYLDIQALDGRLTSKLRYQVLEWVLAHTRHKLEDNLTLHIFGEQQLRTWYKESKERYPDFELVLLFAETLAAETAERCIVHTFYYRRLPSAPSVDDKSPFPVGHWRWLPGDNFWMPSLISLKTDVSAVETTMHNCPNQAAFSYPETAIASRLLIRSAEEQKHQSVAELLGLGSWWQAI